MADPSSTSSDPPTDVDDAADAEPTDEVEAVDDLEALRREVEEKYDFSDFGPADMAEMSAEEWEAVFDPEAWITGAELLDRVERDLEHRIATREVFAVLERIEEDGAEKLLAYSDEGYAIVGADGAVEGSGTVLRDVKPTVALCSMESYEVPDPPEDFDLPRPETVVEQSGELGNTLVQVLAASMLLGSALLGLAWLFDVLGASVSVAGQTLPSEGFNATLALITSLAFLLVGLFLFLVVANARLSDRFRAEEYRNRLRALDREDGERPEFLPDIEEHRPETEGRRRGGGREGQTDRGTESRGS